MENKTNNIVSIIMLSVFILLFAGLFIYGIVMSNKEEKTPVTTTTSTTTRTTGYSSYEDEVATFHGGSGEVTYETVIYKVPNGQYNMGFKYENRTCTTRSWGSSEWDCSTTKIGEVTWTEDVFLIAKNNGAYSYVTRPNDSKTYSINEFEKMFIMD